MHALRTVPKQGRKNDQEFSFPRFPNIKFAKSALISQVRLDLCVLQN